jgi:HJR/Mrr/RecB family endonuclease
MVDWLTHSLVSWITGKTIKLEITLLMIGSLIPDLFKSYLVFNLFSDIETQDFFYPLHTPIGAILIAVGIALFFPEIKKALIFLGIGITTHFILDLFLLNVSGGISLLFPFSWEKWQVGLWQYNVIRSEDYMVTIYAVITAVAVYFIYVISDRRKETQYQLSSIPSEINTKKIIAKKNIVPSVKPIRATPQAFYSQMKPQKSKPIQQPREKKPIVFPDIDLMTDQEFEQFLMDFFKNRGYTIEKRKRSHEQGLALLLEKNNEQTMIQTKRCSTPVGNTVIQEVNNERDYLQCSQAIVLTNSRFTNTAKQLAGQLDVDLWDREKLEEIYFYGTI